MNISNYSKRIGGKKQFGQGMTEYIIIVALVAIGAIGVYNLFGKTVRDSTSAMALGLAGNKSGGDAQLVISTKDGTDAAAAADKKQGLDNFTQSADEK
jgi:Flp pilus assembly pilin Flp